MEARFANSSCLRPRYGWSALGFPAVRNVIYSLTRRNFRDFEWVDALQTADVVAVFLGIGPALMMGINAAVGAKVVLCGVGVELVELQGVVASQNPKSG